MQISALFAKSGRRPLIPSPSLCKDQSAMGVCSFLSLVFTGSFLLHCEKPFCGGGVLLLLRIREELGQWAHCAFFERFGKLGTT